MTTTFAQKRFTLADAHQAGPLLLVDDNRVYRFRLHLGSAVSWRDYKHGEWVKGELETLPDGRSIRHYEHRLASHDVGPVKGITVNGLIVSHNDFLKNNLTPTVYSYAANGSRVTRPNLDALVNRAILVSDVREVDELPMDETVKQRQSREHRTLSDAMAAIAESNAKIAAVLEKQGRK